MKRCIWITWEVHRRNRGICLALGWPLYEISYKDLRLLRYIKSALKTIKIIASIKPKIVVTQNPSIFLSFLSICFSSIFRYKTIVDSHNSGLFPLEGRSKILMTVSKWIQKNTDLTLVTNQNLMSVVENNHGKAFVLPDKIPSVPETSFYQVDGKINVAYICTFSEDEPYEEVLKSASYLAQDVYIYITGKYDGKIKPKTLCSNVRLVGFIPDKEYWSLLSSADIIMDLTLREDCLVCGGYEGLALGKPLILSDTIALRSYFSRGCIYVSPNSRSIAYGIEKAIQCYTILDSEINLLRDELDQKWSNRLEFLKEEIDAIPY